MTDPDLNALRRIIGEQRGLTPRTPPPRILRRRQGRLHAPRVDSVGDIVKLVLCAVLTTVAAIAAFTAGHLTMFWIGDHAATHGREWSWSKSLGFRVEDLPGIFYVDHSVYAELRLLVWFVVLAVLVALTYRPGFVAAAAFVGGLVPQTWWTHVPTTSAPHWAVTLIARQATWFPHASPWAVWAALLVVAGTATAWAAKAQTV